MGIFDDFDVAAADSDPFKPDPGTYRGITERTRVQEWPNGSKSLITTCVVREGDQKGKRADKSLRLPDKSLGDDENARRLSFLHQYLSGLDVPKAEMNTVKPAELDNLPVVFTIKESKVEKDGETNTYLNVTKVVIDSDRSPVKGAAVIDADTFADTF